ncbi:MAG: hypothetical protein AB7S86_09135 [Hydrogenophaga sp.]|uniref:hypothetical protein n=1 Tax=Hydrogenophaga sp. TaxID=1904254 RepID=UPI003D0D23FE
MRFTKIFQDDFNNNVSGMLMNAGGTEAMYTFLYLLAGPQSNYIGLYPLNLRKASFDTRLPEARLRALIEQFQELGFVKHDPSTGVLWLLDAAERNIGELKGPADGKKGDLKLVLVSKEFDAVPAAAAELRAEFHSRYADMLKLKPMRAPAAAAVAPKAPAPAPAPAPHPAIPAALAEEVDVQPSDINVSERIRDEYNTCLSTLKNLRLGLRDEYPASQDARFNENVAIVTKEWGHQLAADVFTNALRSGDLNLVAAVQRLEEPEAADI